MPNRLVQFSSPLARKVRGTDIKIGDPLYAIQDIATKLYFIWCYTDRNFAERIMGRIRPDNALDISANWRRDKGQLTPTDRNH